jgi:hypothetical protein
MDSRHTCLGREVVCIAGVNRERAGDPGTMMWAGVSMITGPTSRVIEEQAQRPADEGCILHTGCNLLQSPLGLEFHVGIPATGEDHCYL